MVSHWVKKLNRNLFLFDLILNALAESGSGKTVFVNKIIRNLNKGSM